VSALCNSSQSRANYRAQAYTVLIDASQREAYNARLQQHLQDALDDYTGAAAPVLAIWAVKPERSCTLRLEVPRHWSLRELSEAVQHLRAKKAGYVKHVSFL